MATKLTDPTHSDGEAGEPARTKCPLCQATIDAGGLNVHYLTSCTNYDIKDSSFSDEPKSKPSHRTEEPPAAITSTTRTTTAASTAAAEPAKLAELGGSGSARTPSSVRSRELSNVMFMWQPYTQEMVYPSVTLLASFQRGSVELKRDSEGSHYASSYVDIAKGTYQGQLVLGTMGQMYEVEEFTVSKDEEVIILQWSVSANTIGDMYNMQSNPSYGAGRASASGSGRMDQSVDPYDTSRHRGYGYDDPVGSAAAPSYKKSTSAPSKAESTGHYFSNDTGRGAGPATTSSFSATGAAPVSASGHSDVAKKKLQLPHEFYTSDASAHDTFLDEYGPKLDLAEPLDQVRGGGGGGGEGGGGGGGGGGGEGRSVREQLELVTKERNSLKNNQQRVEAAWIRRVQRLEEQLDEANKRETAGRGGVGNSRDSRGNQRGSSSSELVELKDRNAALQEQVLEYERTIKAQAKTFTGSALDARQMLNFSKKQQVEQAEQIEDMKRKIEDVLKMQDQYLKVSHNNINLASQLEDYQAQTKLLMKELDDKDEEIARLKDAQGSHNEDRLQLEMETMRQKYEGWKDEVERLLPLEEEAKNLREENIELGQQLAQMVEVGEKQKMTDRHEDGQDALMNQLSALREVRMKNEEELLRLREERAGILNENAALREGNQAQNYMTLQKKFQEVSADVHLYQELNHELSQKLQIATDGSKLRPIQDKMDRYKKERDSARTELDSARMELDSLKDEVAKLEQVCRMKTEELVSAKEENNALRERMSKKKAYSEERQRSREKTKELEEKRREQHNQQHRPHHHHHHHHHHRTSATADPAPESQQHNDYENDEETSRRDGLRAENSPSPVREYRHTSPDQFSLTSEVHHKDIASPTPSMEDSLSPSPLPGSTPVTAPVASTSRGKTRSTEPGHGGGTSRMDSFSRSGAQSGPVEVKTKEGVMLKTIQKPSAPLNFKFKPRVVIKRTEGYEAGTLMFVGKVNDKDIAGVFTDIRQKRTTTTSGVGACDGTYKDGKRYFKCPNGHGVYVSLSKVYIEMESAMV